MRLVQLRVCKVPQNMDNILLNFPQTAWSPAVRTSQLWKEYIQFDFLKPIKLTRVQIRRPSNYIKVTEVTISVGGHSDVLSVVATGEIPNDDVVHLDTNDAAARYARITIDNVDRTADPSSKPIGINS